MYVPSPTHAIRALWALSRIKKLKPVKNIASDIKGNVEQTPRGPE
jgi:hypothetical protein